MIIQSITGVDEINAALTNGMRSTLEALVTEGLLDPEVAEQFNTTHVCIMVDNTSVWSNIRAKLGFPEGNAYVWRATILMLPTKVGG